MTTKESEEQLLQNISHKTLPELPARELFLDRIQQSLARARGRSNYLFAVLLIDLDCFKLINHSFGPVAGAPLHFGFGRRLRTCLRTSDMLARFSGDTYLILLDDIIRPSDTERAVERLQRNLLLPIRLHDHEVFATACIGIALSSNGYARPEELLQDAETAMTRAKAQGAGQFEVFDTSMREQAVNLVLLETDLRRAIDRHELRLQYQPIVSLETSQITAFEALVRWEHPERGLLYPKEFIPVAEETGLIVQISECVLEEACRQVALWNDRFAGHRPWTVSVNLEAKYLAKQDVVREIISIISKSGVEPRNLILELTESQNMENAGSVSKILLDMRDSGLKVSIDDFGTGYSSLAYLASFSVHALKIDRSFVSKLNSDPKKLAIVRAIISLGHSLGLEVIAEGVETEEELQHLQRLGCEHAQGYYISPPMDEDMIAPFIERLSR